AVARAEPGTRVPARGTGDRAAERPRTGRAARSSCPSLEVPAERSCAGEGGKNAGLTPKMPPFWNFRFQNESILLVDSGSFLRRGAGDGSDRLDRRHADANICRSGGGQPSPVINLRYRRLILTLSL